MLVTTIGGATVDIIVSGGCRDDVGTKQDVEAIDIGVGGGAVNASLACRAFGAQVRIVCALGCDAQGEWLREMLRRESVDVSLVQSVADLPTGKAVVHLDTSAEARVFAQRGAGARVSPARAQDAVGRSDLLYVTALSGEAEAELDATMDRMSRQPPRFVINPGRRQIEAGTPALARLLKRADLVIVNESEARLWASRRQLAVPHAPEVDGKAWMSGLRARAGQALLVTLGPRGALLHDGRRVHYLPAQPARARSSLGAGDAFGATFACHWAGGTPVSGALLAARAYSLKVLEVAAANLAARPEQRQ